MKSGIRATNRRRLMTSIPGSNPGGASKISSIRREVGVTSPAPTASCPFRAHSGCVPPLVETCCLSASTFGKGRT